MPRQPSFTSSYDTVDTIEASAIARSGYLRPGASRCGAFKWRKDTRYQSAVGFELRVNDEADKAQLRLKYNCGGTPVDELIEMERIPSNLGKGWVWYFRCPHTHLRCRKLYNVTERFLHRKAFTGTMYEVQREGKLMRALKATMTDIYWDYRYPTHYAGKPTKRYLRHLKKEQRQDEAWDKYGHAVTGCLGMSEEIVDSFC